MGKFILLACFVLPALTGSAQTREIESLQKQLKQHPQQDTTRLDMLNDLAYYYNTTDPAKGLETADRAISLALQLHDTRRLASAYNYKGLNDASMGKDSLAIYWLEKCLAIHKQRNNKHGEAVALHNIGISYANLSQYPKALDCQQQAYKVFEKANYKPGMAATLNSKGVVYLFLSDYPQALRCYLQALAFYEQMNDRRNTGNAFSNIGLVYYHLPDYKKALDYQLKALEIFKESGDDYNMQNTLGNIGNVYSDSGNLTKALAFYGQARAVNEKLQNKSGIASDVVNTGIAYYNANDYINAADHLKKAMLLYDELGNKYGMGSAINYLVGIYLNAKDNVLIREGIRPSMRYEKARALQQKGLQLVSESGNTDIQRDGWKNMSKIYTGKKDFARALAAYKNYIFLRDSILNDEKKAEITRLSMQYEFDKKAAAGDAQREKERAVSMAALNRQKMIKNGIMGGASILLVTGFITFVFYKRKRDAEEQQKEAELHAEVTDTEMKALRAQMNPHFIFNSLNSVSDYMHKHDLQTADRYLTKFASLMRLILEYSEQKEIPLADDLKALEMYMQLEALRLNRKFTYEIDIADNIDPGNILVPPLMLQPFVENSIWHGIAQKQGKGKILIEVKKDEGMISCVVEDDGIGFKDQQQEQRAGRSLGMKITGSRIDLLNKIRNTHATVKLSDMTQGMRVELRLPLVLSF